MIWITVWIKKIPNFSIYLLLFGFGLAWPGLDPVGGGGWGGVGGGGGFVSHDGRFWLDNKYLK